MSEHTEEYTGQFDETFDLGMEGLDDAVEPYALPDGTEAQVRILQVHGKKREDGSQYWLVTLETPEHPFAKLITHFVELPQYEANARRKNTARFRLKAFCEAFGVDTQGSLRLDELVGREGWAILSLQRSETYGDQNRIGRFITVPF